MNIKDELIKCPLSGGNACYHTVDENGHEAWFSYSAGYATDSSKTQGTLTQKEFEEVLPQIYQDLRWVDHDTNLVWYPVSFNDPKKGIVFVDGTSVEDWKWSAARSIRLTKQEQKSGKFSGELPYKIDIKNMKSFERADFIEALDYIGGFK